MANILDKTLSADDKEELLEELLGLQIGMNGRIIDSSGFEFRGFNPNSSFDFNTLRGIIEYLKAESHAHGIRCNQASIRSVLGV